MNRVVIGCSAERALCMRWLKRLGERSLRRFPALPIAFGMVLAAPSLFGGLAADDLFIYATVGGLQPAGDVQFSPWEPYTYFNGDPERTLAMMDRGWFPWWTDPHCRASLGRPLTALTFMLDDFAWADHPVFMHLQSLLWYGLVVGAVAVLYRRVMGRTMPPWVAAVAAVLFAIDESHAIPAGWLANRNTLIAAFFGCVTLICHDRWCRDGCRRSGIAAPVLLLVALCGKEEAICTCAYLLAYAVFLDQGSWSRRLARFLPCVAVAIAWYVGYEALGYGAARSGGYVDPAANPIRFAERVLSNGPLLLMGQWALPASDLGNFESAGLFQLHWLLAIAFLCGLGVMLAPLLRRDASSRFWAAGSVLSVIPVCAIFTSDRLLMFVGIGAMGLLAQWLHGLSASACWVPESKRWTRCASAFRYLLVGVHLVLAPLVFPASAISMRFVSNALERIYTTLPAGTAVANQTLVFANTFGSISDLVWVQARIHRGDPLPARTVHLNASWSAAKITRVDANTLSVQPHGGYLRPRRWTPQGEATPLSFQYLGQHLDSLTRSPDHPMELGDKVELTAATIEVVSLTDDGRPAEVTFSFSVPLEDPSLRWLAVTTDGYVPFAVPAIGQTVAVRAPW